MYSRRRAEELPARVELDAPCATLWTGTPFGLTGGFAHLRLSYGCNW